MKNKPDSAPALRCEAMVSRFTLREACIMAARKHDPDIGDDAMIAPMEWGYWVGSTYVSKEEVSSSANNRDDRRRAADSAQPNGA